MCSDVTVIDWMACSIVTIIGCVIGSVVTIIDWMVYLVVTIVVWFQSVILIIIGWLVCYYYYYYYYRLAGLFSCDNLRLAGRLLLLLLLLSSFLSVSFIAEGGTSWTGDPSAMQGNKMERCTGSCSCRLKKRRGGFLYMPGA